MISIFLKFIPFIGVITELIDAIRNIIASFKSGVPYTTREVILSYLFHSEKMIYADNLTFINEYLVLNNKLSFVNFEVMYKALTENIDSKMKRGDLLFWKEDNCQELDAGIIINNDLVLTYQELKRINNIKHIFAIIKI